MALAMVYPLDALTVFLGCKSCNLSTAYTNLDVVDAELGKEITAGQIINDPIKKEDLSVHYSSVNDAVALLFQNGQGTMMAKIDLKAALHLIPVRAVE